MPLPDRRRPARRPRPAHPGEQLAARALPLVLALVAACTPSLPPAAAPSPTGDAIVIGGTLRIGQASDPASLDPWTGSDSATLTVLRQIYEPLVDLEPGGFRIVPKLAERWAASPDGRTWTFQLRQGVRFHDGTAFDAAAVAFNFERARAFARFDLATLVSSVQTPDPSTVLFTLRTPFAPFLATLATPSFGIVSPTCLRQGPGWATPATRCAAGTGPFRFESWVAGDRITLARNPFYWGRDPSGRSLPYLDAVVFRALRDEPSRIGELRAANIDVALDIGASSLSTVRSDPNLAIRRRPSADVSYLGIGRATPAFASSDARRAIAMAIDRQAIVHTVFGGDARVASQLVPPDLLGHDETVQEFARLDVAAAKRLLVDAGVPSGTTVELQYAPAPRASLPDPKRMAESLAADLAKAGIEVTVRSAEPSTLAAAARAGTVSMWLGEQSAERADPDEFLADVSTNPVVIELLRRARAELDQRKRAELYKQVSKLLQQEAVRIPLFHSSPPIALTRKVPGLTPQPIVGESFAMVWIGR